MAQHTEAESTQTVQTSGWFRMDPISKVMGVMGALALVGVYVPLVLDPGLEVAGYPWLFASQPIAGMIVGTVFLVATYYTDSKYGGDE